MFLQRVAIIFYEIVLLHQLRLNRVAVFSIITEIIILLNVYCYAVHFKSKASMFISDFDIHYNCWLFDSFNYSLMSIYFVVNFYWLIVQDFSFKEFS